MAAPGAPAQPTWAPGSSAPSAASSAGGALSQLARLLMLIGLAAAAVGCVLSWAEISAFGVSEKVNGLETDDGKFFIGVALIGLLLAVLAMTRPNPRPLVIAVIVMSVVLLLGGLYEIGDINNDLEETFGEDYEDIGKVGVGLYILVAGAIASLIGSIKGLRDTKKVAPSYAPPPSGAPGGGWQG